MGKSKLEEVKLLLKLEKAEEARTLFEKIEPLNTIEYLLLKGQLEQKFQNLGEALNAFSKVVEIDPDNIEAKNNIHIIQNILSFWNPEMFNP